MAKDKKAVKPKNTPFWETSQVFDWVVEVLLLVIIFLVPTFFDRRLGIVFSGSKVALLRALGAVVLGVWATKLIVTRQHRFIRTVLDWPVVSYLLCATVATLSSVHVYTSVVGFYGRYEGLTTWYLFGLLFFIVTNYVHSLDQLKRIIVVVASSSTLMAVYSIIQRHSLDPYMWGGVLTWQRVIGTIGQPNFMAAYMLMAFFLVLALMLMKPGGRPDQADWAEQLPPLGYFIAGQFIFVMMIYNLEAQNVFLWYSGFALVTAMAVLFAFTYQQISHRFLNLLLGFVLVLNFVAIMYTQSRGGFLGLMTGAVLFGLAAGRRWLLSHWKKFAALGFFILLISGYTMLNPEFSPVERFTSEIKTEKIESEQGTERKLELGGAAGSRGETWKSAFGVIADHPFFGVGPEVLKMIFPRYETDLFRFKEAFHVKQDRCHNETFDVSVTKGLVTFFVYGWLLLAFFWTGWRKINGVSEDERLLIAGLLGASLAYLIQNQFSFGVVAITSLFWVMWGMMMVVGRRDQEQEQAKSINWLDIPWFAGALVWIAVALVSWVSFFSFNGDIFFKTGKTYLEMQRFPQAVEEFERSLQAFPFEGTAVSHLAIAYLNLSNTEPNERVKYLARAVETLEYGTVIDPYNADNYYMLAKIYLMRYSLGDQGSLLPALRCTGIALKIDPFYAEVYQTVGQIKERQGKLAEAAPYFEQAFMINPNLQEPMNDLERVLNRLGRPGEVAKVYEKALAKYSDNPTVLERVARVYLQQGNISGAKKLSERLVRYSPELTIGYILRAVVAEKQGDLAAAEQDLQQVLMKEPKNVLARSELAQVYLRRNEPAKARSEFEQIIMLEPGNGYAREMLNRLK